MFLCLLSLLLVLLSWVLLSCVRCVFVFVVAVVVAVVVGVVVVVAVVALLVAAKNMYTMHGAGLGSDSMAVVVIALCPLTNDNCRCGCRG